MPPNVAGWKGGKDWIDSSTLLFRLRLPLMIFHEYPFEYNVKPGLESRDSDMIKGNKSRFEKLKINADWQSLYSIFSKFSQFFDFFEIFSIFRFFRKFSNFSKFFQFLIFSKFSKFFNFFEIFPIFGFFIKFSIFWIFQKTWIL